MVRFSEADPRDARPNATRRRRVTLRALALAPLVVALGASGCLERGDRWTPSTTAAVVAPPPCTVGAEQCNDTLQRCEKGKDGPTWQVVDDCPSRGLVCAPGILACTTCVPQTTRCSGATVERCSDDGSTYAVEQTCATDDGYSCRDGVCVNLCALAAQDLSNVGCEYWGVDLDNADIDDTLNAAAQQYAIVVSNPEPDVAATVTVEQDDSSPGQTNAPYVIANATIPSMSLTVFKLGPREVDGSPAGTYNTGSNTAVTRHAYRVKSNVPVVAYQFNPLDNVNVFSNDASLLKPVEALGTASSTPTTAYVVLGWPQTIAVTDDPNTNFSSNPPTNLRAFLAIVGTRDATHVRVHTKTRVVPGGPIAETEPGGTIDYTLGPFDVLNLETGDFNADFTGSLVDSDQPVVVFSGGEASDAPSFSKLSQRQCCADHLEQQLDPIRTAGERFVATISPNRTKAILAAGATTLSEFDAPEFFRVAASTSRGAVIHTTLAAPYDTLTLSDLGDFANITATADFYLESTDPVSLASVSPSQAASGVPTGLPGGDPSLLVIPPIEQFRSTYVFLTPDKYVFDFIRIVAPAGAEVLLDGNSVDKLTSCTKDVVVSPNPTVTPASFSVYRCQLSFPVISESTTGNITVSPGVQNDGVHQVVASQKVSVLVDGFDRNVSYAYAAGTELVEIVPQ